MKLIAIEFLISLIHNFLLNFKVNTIILLVNYNIAKYFIKFHFPLLYLIFFVLYIIPSNTDIKYYFNNIITSFI